MQTIRRQLILGANAPTGEGVRIAVLDSGIDLEHPDLKDRVDKTASRSFSYTSSLDDSVGHGTHIAGIIAGTGAASAGAYRGIAPAATLLIYKIAMGARGPEGNAAAAIEAAIDDGANIINYSHGFNPRDRAGSPPWIWASQENALEAAFRLASDNGVLCVVAAGNEGPAEGSITRPGGMDCVLTVGALSRNGRVWNSSGRGPYRHSDQVRPGGVRSYHPDTHPAAKQRRKPDVVAPGEGIVAARSSLMPRDSDLDDPIYTEMSGTSQATAVVTGLAACLLSLAIQKGVPLGGNIGRTLRRLLVRSARPITIGTSADFGEGVLKWPFIGATLNDLMNDSHFRSLVLDPNEHDGSFPHLRAI